MDLLIPPLPSLFSLLLLSPPPLSPSSSSSTSSAPPPPPPSPSLLRHPLRRHLLLTCHCTMDQEKKRQELRKFLNSA